MSDYQILKNIEGRISLNDSEREYLESSLILREVLKKETVLKQGQICKNLYFVEYGSFRAFNIDQNGRESTIMFAVKDWWITDMDCFVNRKPALLSIEALETSGIFEWSFEWLEGLYEKIPKFERFFRILFQNSYIREQRRALYNISMTTEDRYRQFVNSYPAIVEKITQKQIASYLGVTPEFLSSIKRK